MTLTIARTVMVGTWRHMAGFENGDHGLTPPTFTAATLSVGQCEPYRRCTGVDGWADGALARCVIRNGNL